MGVRFASPKRVQTPRIETRFLACGGMRPYQGVVIFLAGQSGQSTAPAQVDDATARLVPMHPIQQHRAAVTAAWRDVVYSVSPKYREIPYARLMERVTEGVDALVYGAIAIDHERVGAFLASLVASVDRYGLSVEEVIAALVGGYDALDSGIPHDQRYRPEMIESEKVIRLLLAQFAEHAVGLVTRKLEVEASLQRESRAKLLALQRIGAAVTSSLEIESTLETIVQEAAELMNGASARLRLADETGQNLRLIASSGDLGDDLPGSVVPVESTLAGLCYRSGRPVISNDVASDPRANDDVRSQTRTRSLLSVPLIVRASAIGVLSITNLTERPFEESDAEMLSLFADHAAVAIENGRLFQQAQSQITEMEILNRVSAVVSASLDLTAVFRSIHQEIARIMIADAFVIILRNPVSGFDISYVIDLGQEYAPRHNQPIPAIYHESMDRRVPIMIETSTHDDFARWERYGDMTRRVQSILIAPLYRGSEAIGTLSAQSYASNAYRQRDADLLSTVANVAAVAIENARLYEQAHGAAVAEERNRLAREIHDTIAQGLVGIILQLEAVSASLGDDSESPLQRRLSRAINLARVNLDEARRSVRDLRAAPLEHMSLAEALVQLAEQHEEECETDVHIDVPAAMPLLDPTVETALFRFVQESLSNCRKHARESTVWIRAHTSEAIEIEVRDDGPGFDVEAYRREASSHHFGLHGMRERIERLGGTLEIVSSIGAGTQLGIRLPLVNVTVAR